MPIPREFRFTQSIGLFEEASLICHGSFSNSGCSQVAGKAIDREGSRRDSPPITSGSCFPEPEAAEIHCRNLVNVKARPDRPQVAMVFDPHRVQRANGDIVVSTHRWQKAKMQDNAVFDVVGLGRSDGIDGAPLPPHPALKGLNQRLVICC